MVKFIPLDKILVEGVTYETDKREVLVIEAVGTDAASDVYLEIDGKATGKFKNIIAPMKVTSSNKLGPLKLGELFYVVPPFTKLKVVGPSGAKVRIIGRKLILDVHEATPSEYLNRFYNQHNAYVTYLEGTYELGTDVTWKAGAEYTIIEYTPKTIEKIILNGPMMVNVSGNTVNPGDFGVKIYLNNNPIENILGTNIQDGIDVLSCPRPPSDSAGEEPFTFAKLPIEVPGDVTLKVNVKNTSTGDKPPASGSSWSVTVTLVVSYYRLR